MIQRTQVNTPSDPEHDLFPSSMSKQGWVCLLILSYFLVRQLFIETLWKRGVQKLIESACYNCCLSCYKYMFHKEEDELIEVAMPSYIDLIDGVQ